MKIILPPILLVGFGVSFAQSNSLGFFETNKDIGIPKIKGSVMYDEREQTYTIKSGGYNIWFVRDEFHYAFSKIKGDFILTANMKLLGKGVDPHRQIGWMVRVSEQEDCFCQQF